VAIREKSEEAISLFHRSLGSSIDDDPTKRRPTFRQFSQALYNGRLDKIGDQDRFQASVAFMLRPKVGTYNSVRLI
jgi:hypothetical protein